MKIEDLGTPAGIAAATTAFVGLLKLILPASLFGGLKTQVVAVIVSYLLAIAAGFYGALGTPVNWLVVFLVALSAAGLSIGMNEVQDKVRKAAGQ